MITRSVEFKSSVAAGEPTQIGDLKDVTVQVAGTFSATLDLEATQDGTRWTKVGSSLTAGGFVEMPKSVSAVRANTTIYGSGAATISVGGRERGE